MSEKIVQLNEEVIKSQIKELVRGSVEETLNELFEGRAQEISVSNDVNSFILQFKKTVKPYINKNIVIDISCVRIPDMFSIMKILK